MLFYFFLTEVVIETLYSYFGRLLLASVKTLCESSLLIQLDSPSATPNTTDQRIHYHCRCSVFFTPDSAHKSAFILLIRVCAVWWLNVTFMLLLVLSLLFIRPRISLIVLSSFCNTLCSVVGYKFGLYLRLDLCVIICMHPLF